MQYQAEMANKMTTAETLALRFSQAANRDNPIAIARAHNNRCGHRKGNGPRTKNPNVLANGRYSRQALNQSRQLLAPIQVAPQKSTITPTRYINRRSSETASEAPNTAPAANTPRPSEPNLNFHLPPSAGVSFIIALWIRMHVRARLDSKFSKRRIDSGRSVSCCRWRGSLAVIGYRFIGSSPASQGGWSVISEK